MKNISLSLVVLMSVVLTLGVLVSSDLVEAKQPAGLIKVSDDNETDYDDNESEEFENETEEFEDENESEGNFGNGKKVREEISQTFIDANGNEVQVRARVETKIKNGEIEQKFKVRMANGKDASVKILPATASQKAIDQFESRNVSVVLKEVGEGNNMNVVYEVEGNKTVKFLGLFKVRAQLRAVIDADTNEVLDLDKPWWYFMAFGKGTIDCDLENLDLCDVGECGDLDMIWFNESCVAGCPEDAFVCEDNVTVVVRNESLGCEFDACPVFVPVVNDTLVNDTVVNDTLLNDSLL